MKCDSMKWCAPALGAFDSAIQWDVYMYFNIIQFALLNNSANVSKKAETKDHYKNFVYTEAVIAGTWIVMPAMSRVHEYVEQVVYYLHRFRRLVRMTLTFGLVGLVGPPQLLRAASLQRRVQLARKRDKQTPDKHIRIIINNSEHPMDANTSIIIILRDSYWAILGGGV